LFNEKILKHSKNVPAEFYAAIEKEGISAIVSFFNELPAEFTNFFS